MQHEDIAKYRCGFHVPSHKGHLWIQTTAGAQYELDVPDAKDMVALLTILKNASHAKVMLDDSATPPVAVGVLGE